MPLRGTLTSICFPMPLLHGAHCHQMPPASLQRRPRRAASSRWLFAAAPLASHKPHSAEKSTPVWLAIWRTWAGFANSQLRRAAFRCTDSYICTHPRYCCLEPLLRHSKSLGPSAPIAYATSVSLPDEAVAWQGRRRWLLDMATAWPGAEFEQITARANPCSRHLWGTLARAVASI